MSFWEGIIACGLAGFEAVSLAELLHLIPDMYEVENAVKDSFAKVFHYEMVESSWVEEDFERFHGWGQTILKIFRKSFLNSLLFMSLLLPGWAAPLYSFYRQDNPAALVRIDPGGQPGLAELAGMGLSVYATLYTTRGSSVLVAAADELDQKEILRRGFPLKVLDPDISGAEYFLLYGSAQDLSDAKMLTEVLLIESSMAVARMNC